MPCTQSQLWGHDTIVADALNEGLGSWASLFFCFVFTFPREKTFSNYRHGPSEWVSTVKFYPGKKKTVAYLEKHIIVLEHLKTSYSTASSLRAGAAVPKCNTAKGTKLMYESCVQRRPGASSYFVMLWGYGCSPSSKTMKSIGVCCCRGWKSLSAVTHWMFSRYCRSVKSSVSVGSRFVVQSEEDRTWSAAFSMYADAIMCRHRSEFVVLIESFKTMLILTYLSHKKVTFVVKIGLSLSGSTLWNH